MYEYRAEVVRIVDGDTIRLKVDVGFRLTTEQSFRLRGIDTPELRDRDPEMRERAQLAKARLAELCPVGSEIVITTYKADKYGRWLAEVWPAPVVRPDLHGAKVASLRSANEILVEEGHAKAYHGGKR